MGTGDLKPGCLSPITGKLWQGPKRWTCMASESTFVHILCFHILQFWADSKSVELCAEEMAFFIVDHIFNAALQLQSRLVCGKSGGPSICCYASASLKTNHWHPQIRVFHWSHLEATMERVPSIANLTCGRVFVEVRFPLG